MESNYDKQVQIARELFLEYDQEAILAKFDLEYDENYIYLTFIGDTYRISRHGGEVEKRNESGGFTLCADYNVVMSLYDALCYPKETPRLSGEFCPLYSLQVTMSSPNEGKFIQKYAQIFAQDVEALRQACQILGDPAQPLSAGADVCCKIDVFPFFPVQFRFWDADDEFPAKIQLLWDRNSLQFMHFETLYYVMGPLIDKLLQLFRKL